jgi:hypothetical protein
MIYQNGIYTVQRCDYYQQLAARENGDMAFLHVYIRMGSTRCKLLAAL